MNSYLLIGCMICHLTISEDTGFAFLFFFSVYVKNLISTSEVQEYVRSECYNDIGLDMIVKG